MKLFFKRFAAAFLALALACPTVSAVEKARAAETEQPELPVEDDLTASVLVDTSTAHQVTLAASNLKDGYSITPGGVYTLIVLPRGSLKADPVTASDLVAAMANNAALYVGTATARSSDSIIFSDVRLRAADAVDYFFTGPGFPSPVKASGGLTILSGTVQSHNSSDHSATITLIDTITNYGYDTDVRAKGNGEYFQQVAPGTYDLRVEKPGYLPTLFENVQISGGEMKDNNLDITPQVGDVNSDGKRDSSDLTTLLSYVGAASDLTTADFNGDGVLTIDDIRLLTARLENIPSGSGTPSGTAKINVTDTALESDAASGLHKLTFSLSDSGVSTTAASFSLTFRRDQIQPTNSSGGAITPADGGTVANCLADVASGLTISSRLWHVTSSDVTLSFTLFGNTTSSELISFYYRPISARGTEDFYKTTFSLPQCAALVGKDQSALVTDYALTYPNSDKNYLTSIVIDTPQSTTLTIPSGQDTLVAFSATGQNSNTDASYSNLTGLTWAVYADENLQFPASGVSISSGLLRLTSSATPGKIYLVASRDDITSPPLALTLQQEPPVVTSLRLYREDALVSKRDSVTFSASYTANSCVYTAMAYDQYGNAIQDPTSLTFQLSGAPSGLSVKQTGNQLELKRTSSLAPGTYTFQLYLYGSSVSSVLSVTLAVLPTLEKLVISGPKRVARPAEGQEFQMVYRVSGQDSAGHPYPLESHVTISASLDSSPEIDPVEGLTFSTDALSGEYILHLTSAVAPNVYSICATYPSAPGEVVTATFLLTVSDTTSGGYPVLELSGQPLSRLERSLPAGEAVQLPLEAKIMDSTGAPLADQPTFTWGLSETIPGITLDSSTGLLSVSETVSPGTYLFSLTATSPTSDAFPVGYSITLPVELTLYPVLKTLALQAPGGLTELTIPRSGTLDFALLLSATDAQGNSMALPETITWAVTNSSGKAVSGVSIADGVLSVTSSAKAGEISVTASYLGSSGDSGEEPETEAQTLALAETDFSAAITSNSLALTLKAPEISGQLVLYRDSTRLSETDSYSIEEGTGKTLTYSARLVKEDGTTQTLTPDDGLTWLTGNTFSIPSSAEWGSYSSDITAVYAGQAVTVTSTINVYPAFPSTNSASDPTLIWDMTEPLYFPAGGSVTYSGPLLVKTASHGTIPFSALPQNAAFRCEVNLSGMSAAYDRETNLLSLTVTAAAANAFPSTDDGLKTLGLAMAYRLSGASTTTIANKFDLSGFAYAPSRVQTALLRQGTGKSASFSFTTAKSGDTLSVSQGTLSYLFALELQDQYGKAMKPKSVKFSLTDQHGASVSGISLFNQSDLSEIYSQYALLARLKVTSDVTIGEHPLRLTARSTAAQGSTDYFEPITLDFTLSVSAPGDRTVQVSGPQWLEVPIYYATLSDPTDINTTPNTADYTVTFGSSDDFQEVDPGDYSVSWSLENPADSKVSCSPSTGGATLSVSPGAKASKTMSLVATVTQGGQTFTGSLPVELSRDTAAPAILKIFDKDGKYVSTNKNSTGTYLRLSTAQGTATASETYSFKLYDQYGDRATAFESQVKWGLNGNPTGVTLEKSNGTATIHVSALAPSGKRTLTLGAYYGSSTSVFQDLYFTLSVTAAGGDLGGGGGSLGGGGGGGGGGLGGDDEEIVEEEPLPTPEPVPNITLVPSVSQSGTAGSAKLTEEQEAAALVATGSTMTFAPTGGSGLKSMELTLSGALTSAAASKNLSWNVQTALGTVTLPAAAVKSLANQGSGDVTISISTNSSRLTISFKKGGTTLSNLGAPVSISIPTSGTIAYEIKNGTTTLLPKLVVENGKLLGTLSGSTQLMMTNPTMAYDDTESHWAKSAISFVSGRALFQGTGGSNFSPDLTMDRGMIVTVLHRLEQTPASGVSALFDDVSSGAWYADGVAWASSQGIVEGSGGSFSPEGTLTREQLATILYRYARFAGFSTGASSSLNRFGDNSSVSSWAKTAMQWCVSQGLITGKTGGLLDPQGSATRAEVATTLQRLITWMAKA